VATTSTVSQHLIPQGVQPLRAGTGIEFYLRRLHSLSGTVAVGAFLVEHFASNAFATNGPKAYADQVKFLTGLPFVEWLEWGFIYIPLLFHALYGFWIWYQGESNVGSYAWRGNWGYTLQRWTGGIAFFYILWHVITIRYMGTHLLHGGSDYAFAKVAAEMAVGWKVAFYAVGITTASWHFAYGLFLFCAKWGIVTGEKGQERFLAFCFAIFVVFVAVGLYSEWAFMYGPFQQQMTPLPTGEAAVVQISKFLVG
jgi:succinate dehydrogenase / fumarate reductase cytochrome b subunit